jgi:hypothetical protein
VRLLALPAQVVAPSRARGGSAVQGLNVWLTADGFKAKLGADAVRMCGETPASDAREKGVACGCVEQLKRSGGERGEAYPYLAKARPER